MYGGCEEASLGKSSIPYSNFEANDASTNEFSSTFNDTNILGIRGGLEGEREGEKVSQKFKA